MRHCDTRGDGDASHDDFSGALTGGPSPDGDVDFYRLSLSPGTRVLSELVGNDTAGELPLGDTYLGLYSEDARGCLLETFNDDGAGAGGSRLRFNVPANGTVILAATACCDSGFEGNHSAVGAYNLTVQQSIEGSIDGRIVEARNGSPLSSTVNARYEISECASAAPDAPCSSFTFLDVESDGRIRYPTSGSDAPLQAGRTYLLAARATGFEDLPTRFTVTGAGVIELGDIALTTIPVVRRIQARLIESNTGAPIVGGGPVFGRVELLSCNEKGNACALVASGGADSKGVVIFRGADPFGTVLRPGTYRLAGASEEHAVRRSPPFRVEKNQSFKTTLKLSARFPVKLSEIRPCGAPPTEGGTCAYSARINNTTTETVAGGAWSVVEGISLGSPVNSTLFQTGKPQRFSLPPGGSAVLRFQFKVPATLDDDANLCADIYVGRGTGSDASLYFETVRAGFLFCVDKGPTGELSLVTGAEAEVIRADIAKRKTSSLPASARP